MTVTKPEVRGAHRANAHDNYVAAMWIRFLLAPGTPTAPGEPVDLGEIGEVRQKNWERLNPYMTATPTGR
jgi:hypothetical protein